VRQPHAEWKLKDVGFFVSVFNIRGEYGQHGLRLAFPRIFRNKIQSYFHSFIKKGKEKRREGRRKTEISFAIR
jgi:hypothetical protein